MEQLVHSLLKMRTKDGMKNAYLTHHSCYRTPHHARLSIAILNAPCNGFGDVVFAMKLVNYIKEWYPKCKVTIITTNASGFESLGAKTSNVIPFKTIGKSNCRRFSRLVIQDELPYFDLLFVAPLQADFDINLADVKRLFPYSNFMNTYFFSEYNDIASKKFDFPTGVGGDRMGLFLTKTDTSNMKRVLNGAYAMVYIAESIDGADICFEHFMEMIAKKYRDFNKFQIVVPKWIAQEIINGDISIDKILKYFGQIHVKIGDDGVEMSDDDELGTNKLVTNKLVIRGDIYPLTNTSMLSLMKYSVRDILLTGDQSITDMLSCCKSKNLFYQIAPWKRSLATELSKYLPNKYLKTIKTSCGTMGAINYKSDYTEFVKEWDFRKLGRQHLDNVIMAASMSKHGEYKEIFNILLKRNARSLLREMYV